MESERGSIHQDLKCHAREFGFYPDKGAQPMEAFKDDKI